MLGLIHVDEVDDDDAAHIAQAQLTGDFVGGAQIHVERVGFLVVACFRTVTRVDVNDVQGFGVFDDDVCARFEGDGFAEG